MNMASKKEDGKKDPVASLEELEKAVGLDKTARTKKPRPPEAAPPVARAAAARADRSAAAAREVKAPAVRPKASGGSVRVRLVRSGICAAEDQKATLFGLGLRRIRQEVVRSDTPSLRGMIHKVRHLVEVEER